jgi:hypothetical protein
MPLPGLSLQSLQHRFGASGFQPSSGFEHMHFIGKCQVVPLAWRSCSQAERAGVIRCHAWHHPRKQAWASPSPVATGTTVPPVVVRLGWAEILRNVSRPGTRELCRSPRRVAMAASLTPGLGAARLLGEREGISPARSAQRSAELLGANTACARKAEALFAADERDRHCPA